MTRTICRQIDALANPEQVVGCLIGLGHFEMADRLQVALSREATSKDLYYATEQVEPFVGKFSSPEADDANRQAWDAWTDARGDLAAIEGEIADLRAAMKDALPLGAWENYLGI